MAFYRKRPEVVQATAFHPLQVEDVGSLVKRELNPGVYGEYYVLVKGRKQYLKGGDWILQTPSGVKVMDSKLFHEEYEFIKE